MSTHCQLTLIWSLQQCRCSNTKSTSTDSKPSMVPLMPSGDLRRWTLRRYTLRWWTPVFRLEAFSTGEVKPSPPAVKSYSETSSSKTVSPSTGGKIKSILFQKHHIPLLIIKKHLLVPHNHLLIVNQKLHMIKQHLPLLRECQGLQVMK